MAAVLNPSFPQAGTTGWLADLPRTQVIIVTIKRSGI